MTTSNGAVDDERVEGIIEAINDRGVKVAGEWRNVSKFHPVDLPDRGARVRIALDSKGFIRGLQVLDAASAYVAIRGQRDALADAMDLVGREVRRDEVYGCCERHRMPPLVPSAPNQNHDAPRVVLPPHLR